MPVDHLEVRLADYGLHFWQTSRYGEVTLSLKNKPFERDMSGQELCDIISWGHILSIILAQNTKFAHS